MIKVKQLSVAALVPTRAYATDAGLDLASSEELVLRLGERKLIGTGIAISIPDGYVAYVKPRSGLAVKHGIDVMAGVIDSSYRGEVKVLLVNLSNKPFHIEEGDRIAQLVIHKVEIWHPLVVNKLDDAERGEKGFGSSGA